MPLRGERKLFQEARRLQRQGKHRLGAALYRSILRRSPHGRRWRAVFGLAECLVAVGEVEQAVERFRQLTSEAPEGGIRLLALFRQAHCLDLLHSDGRTPHLDCLCEALRLGRAEQRAVRRAIARLG